MARHPTLFRRHWTVMAELPIYDRALTTADDGTVFGTAGSHCTGRVTAIGDLQITGHYTGFSPDPSTGLTWGRSFSPGTTLGQ